MDEDLFSVGRCWDQERAVGRGEEDELAVPVRTALPRPSRTGVADEETAEDAGSVVRKAPGLQAHRHRAAGWQGYSSAPHFSATPRLISLMLYYLLPMFARSRARGDAVARPRTRAARSAPGTTWAASPGSPSSTSARTSTMSTWSSAVSRSVLGSPRRGRQSNPPT